MEQYCGTFEQWNSIVEQCGEKVWNNMVEQWNSVHVVQCRGTVKRYGGTVEQCAPMEWHSVEQWNSVVQRCEQCGRSVNQCGKTLEQYGGTEEPCEECGTLCWTSGTV